MDSGGKGCGTIIAIIVVIFFALMMVGGSDDSSKKSYSSGYSREQLEKDLNYFQGRWDVMTGK